MTFSDWLEFARANWKKDDGQTMAEYGVVLAVITPAIVLAIALLAGSVENLLKAVLRVLGV